MNHEVEQEVLLKDGRTIFKTHNGFKSFVKSKQGSITEVTDAYYRQALRLKVKK